MDKVICIGKNYPAHAAELGEVQPEKPVLFLKPRSTLHLLADGPVQLDLLHGSIHHELEVVFRLKAKDGQIQLDAVTLGLDLTRRDLQQTLKKSGQPWEIAKVFPMSACICEWLPGAEWNQLKNREFWLKVNGQIRQKALPSTMFWDPLSTLDYARKFFSIEDGDLLFTGTPAGVGPLMIGDELELGWGEKTLGKTRISEAYT